MSAVPSSPLTRVITAHKQGEDRGIYSVCSANSFVLAASLRQARRLDIPLLVESTCNQVNQYGGYARLTPMQFALYMDELASQSGLRRGQLILGGDHLGPIPWTNEPAESALAKGQQLVSDYVRAGYTKIHLDASPRCADDPPCLPKAVAAGRTARLCLVAESAWRDLPSAQPPLYVIGTEVPTPGGAQVEAEPLHVTQSAEAEETLALTQQAFFNHGLEAAWERVIALVVQPGVEFGNQSIHVYQRPQAAPLSRLIEAHPFVYEAHSTDYQTRYALRQMVVDHFAILKVGPALTFTLREAIFALEYIEKELLGNKPGVLLSDLQETLDAAMLAQPQEWQKYYQGDEVSMRFARRYSLSDRCRYYWPVPAVQSALERLFDNLEGCLVPPALLSQFMPAQYEHLSAGLIENNPRAWVDDHINGRLADYTFACSLI